MQTNEKVIALGVGRKGCQTVNNMLSKKIEGVEFVGLRFNVEPEVLDLFDIPLKFNVENAEECKKVISKNFNDADIIFVIGDSPLAPYVAKSAKEAEILTISIVPINNGALKEMLKENSDALISFDENISWDEQIKLSQNVVESIVNLITKSGFVNLDFRDIKAVLQDTGTALFGTGHAEGDNRAEIAALQAINMCGEEIKQAKRILLNITTGNEVSLSEMSDAAGVVEETCDPDAQIIWGHVIDENLENSVKVTFIAGMEDKVSVSV